ncbi:PP2C family protein-serine/threonine phosphatase [Spiroplasma endosymbiont of Amphibalanus improvisus]|uniref:PP2C family protein-serine/threonine phosphatase n=1 Tax=Spiroplasma endosymbiont of Amphibalanus improvisus TaxID=3066327 RepID=UPI00313DB316
MEKNEKIIFCSKTDVGQYRTSNQDYVGHSSNAYGQHIAIVCDGMGGHKHGDKASELCVNRLIEMFNEKDFSKSSDSDINDWLIDTIYSIQDYMLKFTIKNPEYGDMGTTLVTAVMSNSKIFVANVGDSRLYKLHNNKIYQITEDQNIYNSTTQDERTKLLQNPHLKNKYNEDTFWKILTSALGPTKKMKIDTYIIKDTPGQYILTTDGIHDFLDTSEMYNILKSNKKADDKLKDIIQLALDNFSTDNLSALLFEIK